MDPQAETPLDKRKLTILEQLTAARHELHGTPKPAWERALELRALCGQLSQDYRRLCQRGMVDDGTGT